MQCALLDLVVDSTGNSYVYQYTHDSSTVNNITGGYVIKYNPSGQQLWVQCIATQIYFTGKIKLGRDGNIYLGCTTDSFQLQDFMAAKISPNGNLIWQKYFGSPQGAEGGYCNDVALDDSMNLYLVGTTANLDKATIMKCDSAGILQWFSYYDYSTSIDRGNAIDVDNFGNVYVAVSSLDSSSRYEATVVKYYPNGQLNWERRFSTPVGSISYVASFIKIYNDTSVYVGGSVWYMSTGAADYLTMKYDSTGQLKWSNIFDVESNLNLPYNRSDNPVAMLITRTGNIVYTGRDNDNGMPWWVNTMFDSQGNLKWINRPFNAPTDVGRSIVEDRNGYLIFGGEVWNPISGMRMAMTKYDTLGNNIWSTQYFTSSTESFFGTKVNVDYQGNIYASSIRSDFIIPPIIITTLKFDNEVAVPENINNTFEVNVFPNPASTSVTFQLNGFDEIKTLVIYDPLGKEIWRKETDENQIELSVEGFAVGIYFYNIEQRGECKAKGKIIIQ